MAFVKIDVSELTENFMLGIIEEHFYGSCIISDLYIYVSHILNVCIGKNSDNKLALAIARVP